MVDDTPISSRPVYNCIKTEDTCPDQPGLDPIENLMGCKYIKPNIIQRCSSTFFYLKFIVMIIRKCFACIFSTISTSCYKIQRYTNSNIYKHRHVFRLAQAYL